MKVEQMDTTKDGIKSYLDEVAALFPSQSKQWQHKFAVGRFWLDCLGVEEQETRDGAMKQFMATPSPFGCNDSQLAQLIGDRPKRQIATADFVGKA